MKYINIISLSLFLFIFIILIFPEVSEAQISNWGSQLENTRQDTELYRPVREGSTSREDIARYLGLLTGWTTLLALPTMIHLLLGAYEWMTARGNTEQVDKAKKRIRNSLVAGIIMLALYLIAYFFIQSLADATSYDITTPVNP